jgi:hypothetical protein
MVLSAGVTHGCYFGVKGVQEVILEAFQSLKVRGKKNSKKL